LSTTREYAVKRIKSFLEGRLEAAFEAAAEKSKYGMSSEDIRDEDDPIAWRLLLRFTPWIKNRGKAGQEIPAFWDTLSLEGRSFVQAEHQLQSPPADLEKIADTSLYCFTIALTVRSCVTLQEPHAKRFFLKNLHSRLILSAFLVDPRYRSRLFSGFCPS
jgi:hypothetical protein